MKTFSTQISASRERVFDLILEPSLWFEGMVESKFDGPKVPGTRFRYGMREGSQLTVYEGIIVECAKPLRFALRIEQPKWTFHADYLLTEEAGGTKLDYHCHFTPKNQLARVMGFLFSQFQGRVARRHLSLLKKLAEKN